MFSKFVSACNAQILNCLLNSNYMFNQFVFVNNVLVPISFNFLSKLLKILLLQKFFKIIILIVIELTFPRN